MQDAKEGNWRDVFFNHLQQVIQEVTLHGKLRMIGDFNAHSGNNNKAYYRKIYSNFSMQKKSCKILHF